eukprot:6441563-Alexandrium_andersonii.AAC.1
MNRSGGAIKARHGTFRLPPVHLVLNPAATVFKRSSPRPTAPLVAPPATTPRASVHASAASAR